MKRFTMVWVTGILMAIFTTTSASAQEKIWVSSTSAKLKAESKASSQTIAQLPVGEELTVIALKRRWYHVRTSSGKTGWIYRGRITKTPVQKEEPKADDQLSSILIGVSGSSIEADEADSSRSIRGLSPEAKEYARKKKTPKIYQRALDGVIAVQVGHQELETFLEQGKIGEYAE